MANIKITDLTAYGDPKKDDVLPIVDVGADVTKKVSVADLLENAGSGTEALPGIAFDGDQDTGIYRPGADQLAISTNGTERVEFGTSEVVFNDGGENYDFRIKGDTNSSLFFVDASTDRVGLGTTSPSAALHVQSQIYVKGTTGDGLGGIDITSGSSAISTSSHRIRTGGGTGKLLIIETQSADANGQILFNQNGQEAARIDSSRRFLVGASTPPSSSDIASFVSSGTSTLTLRSDSLANNQGAFVTAQGPGNEVAQIGVLAVNDANPTGFLRMNTEFGTGNYLWVDNSGNFRISTTSSHVGTTNGSVVGTQTSDKRLKNVGDLIGYGLNEVLQLQPKKYAFKKEPDTNKLGFIAQEVESIIPEAVFDTGEKLEGHQEGDRTKLGMEYVQLIPVLVNAIKELSSEVDALKAQLQAS